LVVGKRNARKRSTPQQDKILQKSEGDRNRGKIFVRGGAQTKLGFQKVWSWEGNFARNKRETQPAKKKFGQKCPKEAGLGGEVGN